MAQNNLLRILADNFLLLKAKNNSYSLRAYARKLGVSPAGLSEMMNGKRAITEKTVQKIFERLNISPIEKENLKKIQRRKKVLKLEKNKYLQIEMDNYHLISDWYYFAILSLAETKDFESDSSWIANRLNIKIKEAEVAIERLIRLQLLKPDNKNGLVATGASLKTTTDISNASLRKSQSDNLELAKISLERDPVEIRDMSSMTMAIDPELLPEAKKLIKEFRRNLTRFLESEKKQEVYKLNIQLFPLTIVKDQLI